MPPTARRRDQILTTWVLDQLARQRPDDALALIALTAVDLYPDPSWNFVFGQASLTERVGVWSLWRNGTPGSAEYLRRTIMTAAHELTHMLGVQHCTAWECLMNGSNHQAEKDARPLALCPHDLAKLCIALGGCDPSPFELEIPKQGLDIGEVLGCVAARGNGEPHRAHSAGEIAV